MHPDPNILAVLEPRLQLLTTREEKTREAASFLFFTHGIYPSAGTVHKYTGHGSLTDVNHDLQRFWADLRNVGKVKLTMPQLPSRILEQFEAALQDTWGLANEEAAAVLQGERQQLAQLEQQLRNEVAAIGNARDIAEQVAADFKMEAVKLRAELSDALALIEGLKAENLALSENVATWKEQAGKEARARVHSEETFKEALAADREAMQRNIDVLEGEVKFAKMQIEDARSNVKQMQAEYKRLMALRDTELDMLRQRATRAEDLAGDLKLKLADAQAGLIKAATSTPNDGLHMRFRKERISVMKRKR